jgi:TPR repeat protein
MEVLNPNLKSDTQNDDSTLYQLGMRYRFGVGMGQDWHQARILLEQASLQGNFCALVSLAEMYQCGIGVKVDLFMALKLYCQSYVRQRNPDILERIRQILSSSDACLSQLIHQYVQLTEDSSSSRNNST